MTILAVDPGLKGAFAHSTDGVLTLVRMPIYTKTVGSPKRDRDFLDEQGIVDTVNAFAAVGATHLFIEDVGGVPGQSAPASFQFGYGCGVIVTAARCAGFVIERVAPSVWKRSLRVPSDKRASRARASELLPGYSHMWPRQKDDGLAEAAMLTLWAEKEMRK